MLRERRVDIAVTTMNEAGASDLVYQELYTEPFVLFHSVQVKPGIAHWAPAELARLP